MNEPRFQDITERISYLRGISERLAPAKGPAGFADFFVAVVRELPKGRPVSRELLAASLGWSSERLAGLLGHACRSEYYDHGNIVGYGLALRKTRLRAGWSPALRLVCARHVDVSGFAREDC